MLSRGFKLHLIWALLGTCLVAAATYYPARYVYNYFNQFPKYYSFQTLMRAGVDIPANGVIPNLFNLQFSPSAITSANRAPSAQSASSSLGAEAVAFLDFKYETSKSLLKLLTEEKHPETILRSVAVVDNTEFITIESWGINSAKA